MRPSGGGDWDSLWDSVGASEATGGHDPNLMDERPRQPAEPAVAMPSRAVAPPVAPPPAAAAPGAGLAASGLRLIIRTDGAARGNPGPASSGAALIEAAGPASRRPDAAPIASISEYLGVQTNNVAEYIAVVRALALAHELGAREVEMLLDSKLIVEQLHGRWRVKDAKLIPLHAEAKGHLARFARWSATHVPRAQNKQADALCNEAIDRALAGGPRVVVVRPK